MQCGCLEVWVELQVGFEKFEYGFDGLHENSGKCLHLDFEELVTCGMKS